MVQKDTGIICLQVSAYGTLASANVALEWYEAVSVYSAFSNFVAGNNTIAVEVHLRATNSVDMTFDMQVLLY